MREELKALLPAAAHRAVLNVDDVVRAGIAVDEPDEIRAPPRKAARRNARVIVQRLDDRLHARARFVPHVRLVVEHARNGLDRDARRLRDIVDGLARHIGERVYRPGSPSASAIRAKAAARVGPRSARLGDAHRFVVEAPGGFRIPRAHLCGRERRERARLQLDRLA